MSWMRRLLNSGPRQADIERDVAGEIAFHRDQQVADLEAEGWAPEAARREARRRVGLTGIWVAQAVAEDTLPWVATWGRETRQALRGLGRRSWLACTAATTMAVGAGVLLAAFTVVDTAVLAPLPFDEASRLVALEETMGGERTGGNPARVADWSRSLQSMEGVAGLYGEQVVLGRGAEARHVQVSRGIGPFADVLRLRAARGRTFTRQEQQDGVPVVMLTDRGWQRLFGRATHVLEAPITLRGAPYHVVGILPAAIDYPPGVDIVAPAGPEYQRAPRGGNWLQVVGRLAPGATMSRADQEARSAARRFAQDHPATDAGLDVRLTSLHDVETREVREPLLMLLGAAVAVYLVVCVNVGGLLLVRAISRDQESSIRASLGAGAWAMVRLSFHEALLIALASLPLAWLLAHLILRWLAAAMADDVARLASMTLGWRTLLASLFVLIVTVLVIAAWPAWHVATRSTHPRAASHAVTDAPSRRRVRRALVGTQVACSTLLLVLALLFGASVRHMRERPRGFEATHVVALRYDLDWEQPKATVDQLATRVLAVAAATPGVVVAGLADRFPLQGGTQSSGVQLFGEDKVPATRPDVSVRSATPEYFSAMGIPFLSGRPYADGHAARDRHEVVVNAAFARRYFGSHDATGRRIAIRWEGTSPQWSEVVGVIGDVRQSFREEAPQPEVYRPWARAYWPLLHVAVRTDGTPDLLPRLRSALQQAIPDQPIGLIAPLDEVLDAGRRQARMLSRVMTTCAAAAALLAMVGLYGLLAGEMLARQREVGIRLALGARQWRLRAWLVRPGLVLTVLGVGVGLACSLPVGRALESQLFGVGSGDLWAMGSAAGVLCVAGLLAACVPAWRLVGPRALAALRYE